MPNIVYNIKIVCRWEFDGTEEEGTKSIPFQLQKLFLQLQVIFILKLKQKMFFCVKNI